MQYGITISMAWPSKTIVTRTGSGMFLLLALTACVSMTPDAGFKEVREQTGERLATDLQRRDETAVKQTIDPLLQAPLTAEVAVRIALLNNRDLQAAYAGLGISQADLIQAGLLQNPQLAASIGFGGSPREWEASLMGDLLGLITRPTRRQLETKHFQHKILTTTQKVLDLATEVRMAHATLVADAQLLELLQTATKATEAAADLATRQYEAGTASRLEQSMHHAFYARTLHDAAMEAIQVRNDREKLNRLLGLWGKDTDWQYPQRLPEIPLSLPDLTHLEAKAVERNLDVLAAKKDVESLTLALDLTHRFRYLSLLGIGLHTHREPDGQFTGPNITLELPIFDQGQARIARQEAELKQSEEHLAQLAIDLRARIREMRNKVQAAHEHVSHYRERLLFLRQAILEETQRRYNAMLVGVYDLLLAKQNEIETGREYIAMIRDFWLAWAELEQLLGQQLSLPTSAPEPKPATPAAPNPNEHHHHEHHS